MQIVYIDVDGRWSMAQRYNCFLFPFRFSFASQFIEMESAPRNVQVRPLSATMMMITWEPPETPNGQVTVSVLYAPQYYYDGLDANIIIQYISRHSSLLENVQSQTDEW